MNNKLLNLCILPIDAHYLGYVTNYLTCTAMTPIVILRQNAEESHIKRNPSDFYLSVAKTPHPSLPQAGEGALFFVPSSVQGGLGWGVIHYVKL